MLMIIFQHCIIINESTQIHVKERVHIILQNVNLIRIFYYTTMWVTCPSPTNDVLLWQLGFIYIYSMSYTVGQVTNRILFVAGNHFGCTSTLHPRGEVKQSPSMCQRHCLGPTQQLSYMYRRQAPKLTPDLPSQFQKGVGSDRLGKYFLCKLYLCVCCVNVNVF